MTPNIATTATASFTDRWWAVAGTRGPLCLGIAPSTRWLTAWRLPDTVTGARRYCEVTLAAAGDRVAGYKLQVPFFLRFGAAGLDLLGWYARAAREQGALTLIDAKVGDADDTMDSYADLYLGPGSVVGADAVTAHPFLGLESLTPLCHRAAVVGAGVLVLVRTSNHAAGGVQTATVAGRTLAQALADELTSWNERTGRVAGSPVGAVVGARPPEVGDLVARLRYGVLELPGLGRAGRSTPEVVTPARDRWRRAIFPVTTGALRHGPDVDALRASLTGWQAEIDRLLGR